MNLQPANFCGISRESLEGELTCPTCQKIWGTVEGGIYSLNTDGACPHLKFNVENAGGDVEVHYFNGFTSTELMTAVEIAGRLLASDLDGKNRGAILRPPTIRERVLGETEVPVSGYHLVLCRAR